MSVWIFPLTLIAGSLISVAVRLIQTGRWFRTTAEVISLGPPYTIDHNTRVDATMLPTIRFTTATGATVTFEDKKLRLGPAVIGERLDIIYSPTEPRRIAPASFRRRFKLELIPLILGVFFLLLLTFAKNP